MLAADVDDLAGHQHHANAQHVVGRHAILETVRAAGIHGEVTSQRAGELARGIRRIEEAAGGDGGGDREIGDPGLDADGAAREIGIENPRHPRHPDHDRVLGRQRTPTQRRAGAAGDDLDPVLVAVAQHIGHCLGRLRQHDGQRQAAVGGHGVRLERAPPVLIGDDGVTTGDGDKLGHDLLAPVDGGEVGLWQGDQHGGGAFPLASARAASARGLWFSLRAALTGHVSGRTGPALSFKLGNLGLRKPVAYGVEP